MQFNAKIAERQALVPVIARLLKFSRHEMTSVVAGGATGIGGGGGGGVGAAAGGGIWSYLGWGGGDTADNGGGGGGGGDGSGSGGGGGGGDGNLPESIPAAVELDTATEKTLL
jgi:hypothetical protein